MVLLPPPPPHPQHHTSCHEVISEQDSVLFSLASCGRSLGEAEWNCRENEESWTTSLGMAVTSYFISLGLSILVVKRKHWTGSYEVPSSFD